MDSEGFLKLARSRRSVFEFTAEQIPDLELQLVLEAGRWAPSSANSQPWKFIVVKNKKTTEKLMAASYYGFFRSCPALVIALVIPREIYEGGSHRALMKGKIGTQEAYLSISQPALNMCLEAHDLGIGSCIITPEEKSASKALGLRKGDRVPLAVALGYPNASIAEPDDNHARHPLKDIAYYERYGRMKK